MIQKHPVSSNQTELQLNSYSSPVADAWNFPKNSHQSQCQEPQYTCVHQWFEAQVEVTPKAIAVSFLEHFLTYQDLNERANQLAHFLLARGLQPQGLVAISMDRSLELIVSIWGILKAGGAYVPIDPSYPQQRQQYMLQNSQADFLLTQNHLTLCGQAILLR